MAWWNRRAQAAPPVPASKATFNGVVVPPEMTQGGITYAIAVCSRYEALQVPAVQRARNLIAGTLGTLPLLTHLGDRTITPSPLLDQPEADRPRSVTLAMTYEDLLFEGVSWWMVTQQDWRGFPTKIRRCPPHTVFIDNMGVVHVNGYAIDDGLIIRFDSPNPGLLTTAARAIKTALKLEQAADRYADEPMPQGFFTPSGEDIDAEDAQAALDAWKAASQTRVTGYVGAALDYHTVQWSPADLQLADARQHAVLEISRCTGIDAEDLGVSTTSRTYQNDESRRKAFLDFTLGPYISAVQDRLSMNDVTPRGSYVKVDFTEFLRSDTLTRYAGYEKGLAVGAITQEEIRVLEDKPSLTPSAPAITQSAQNESDVPDKTFSADNALTFVSADTAQFKVDEASRTITGLAVPYGPVAASGASKWRFQQGALSWSDTSRVKLLVDHDYSQAVGKATDLTDTPEGLRATFSVMRGEEGDKVLAKAADGVLDGLSVGVNFSEDGYAADPEDETVNLVSSASLREVSITAMPAFDSARVESVRAMANTKEIHVADDKTTETTLAKAVDALALVADKLAAIPAQPQAGDREVIPAGRAVITREAAVYSLDGASGMGAPSLVRDTFAARVDGDRAAQERLAKFKLQQADMAQFATVNRTVGANVIPPGYRPDLYVPQLFQGRPFVDAVSKGALTDATPFTLPKFTSATGATADHVEGTNPTDGSLALGTMTVTPGAVSGLFKITREMVDAANPAIDAIALSALRESYSQQTEAKVYALLNGTSGAGGTITSGAVPSGAVVATVASGATGGQLLLTALRGQLAAYPFRRFQKPDRLLLSQEATTLLAQAVDTTGRPLLPRIGDAASVGTASAYNQAYDIDGLPGVPAWSITANTAADADTFLFSAQDVWAWESPLLNFRFEERSGPAIVELALFGYFATAVLRASGISAVRYN